MAEQRRNRRIVLSRRVALKSLGVGIAGLVLGACGPSRSTSAPHETRMAGPADLSARFARFEAADEPNVASLSGIVWPEFVTRANPEVKQLYEFQLQHGELMRYMACYCGCGSSEHRNNRDCYVQQVGPGDSVVFDAMAPT